MSRQWRFALVFGVAGCLGLLAAIECTTAQEALPPYIIRLRSRSSDVVPQHERNAQTGGGYIEVLHRSPDTIIVIMQGGVVAGSERPAPVPPRCNSASIRISRS